MVKISIEFWWSVFVLIRLRFSQFTMLSFPRGQGKLNFYIFKHTTSTSSSGRSFAAGRDVGFPLILVLFSGSGADSLVWLLASIFFIIWNTKMFDMSYATIEISRKSFPVLLHTKHLKFIIILKVKAVVIHLVTIPGFCLFPCCLDVSIFLKEWLWRQIEVYKNLLNNNTGPHLKLV